MPVQTPLPTKYLINNETDSPKDREHSGNSELLLSHTLATHTPGPWTVHDNPTSNYGLEVTAPAAIKAKRVICRNGGPDREANARLIAAAPEMLAALLQVMADTCDLEPAYCADLVPETRALIRLAIAKATNA